MEIGRLAQLDIVDCHTHFGGEDLDAIDAMLGREQAGGIGQIAILISSFPGRVNANPEGIYAKRRHPDRVYLFAGLDYSAIARDVDHRLTYSLAEQVDRLLAMGCDGIKMLNGKPNYRKASGLALDSIIYDEYFARLQARGFPVLWHVNDPEEFWDPAQAPEWARAPGWIYDDSFPSKESLYGECSRVLARHPGLRVIFAHFYFLSADLPRAAALLERFPGVHLDLAPGIEMFHNFSAQPDQAREFFVRYQDRILFGTDLVEDSPLSRVEVIRRCLETADTFPVPTDEPLFWPDHRTTLRGLDLPAAVLEKVYALNFRRLVGERPRPLQEALLAEELARIEAIQVALGQPADAGGESRDPGC